MVLMACDAGGNEHVKNVYMHETQGEVTQQIVIDG